MTNSRRRPKTPTPPDASDAGEPHREPEAKAADAPAEGTAARTAEHDDGDPFATFSDWDGPADTRAYDAL